MKVIVPFTLFSFEEGLIILLALDFVISIPSHNTAADQNADAENSGFWLEKYEILL